MSKKPKKSYLLPSGKVTTSAKTLLRSWRSVLRPIEKATRSKCYAFGPGATFYMEDGYTFALENRELLLLSAALKGVSI